MAANALRLRQSLALTSSILNHSRNFSCTLPSVAASRSSPSTIQQNPSVSDVNQSKPNSFSFQFISSRSLSSRVMHNNDVMDGDQLSPDAILFEGCDYNHWLITIDFPKDPKPTPAEMVETYVQTAAKVLGSVEEAKKKIYACSTTTYNGFQVECSEQVSEQFKGLPGVVFVLPDSYIDPVNKEYGGDKYINGTIIPRPPPVQYGRQGGRYNDRNREYNRPSPPRASYQTGGGINPSRQTGNQGNFAPPPPVGGHNQERGGSYGGQGGGGGYGGQYGQPGGGNFRQGGGGQYGQGGGGGNYGQGIGGQYGQGGGGGGQYRQGGGGGGGYGQGGGGGGGYGQGGGSGGQYGQGAGGQYGQGVGGGYGQGIGSGSDRSSSQYGENSGFSQADQRRDIPGQQGSYEEVVGYKER